MDETTETGTTYCADPERGLFDEVPLGAVPESPEPVEEFDDLPDEVKSNASRFAEQFVPQAKEVQKVSSAPVGRELLVLHNAEDGYDAVQEHREELEKDLPNARWDLIDAIPALALALAFVSARAARISKQTKRLADLIPRVWELRRMLLHAIGGGVLLGIIPEEDERNIRAGSGLTDAVKDLVALVALWEEYKSQLLGKCIVTQELADEAHALAKLVLPQLKQEGSLRQSTPDPSEVEELRDRLWSLLVEYHEHLVRAGAWKWGTSVTSHVRPLLARQVKRRAATGSGSGSAAAG